MMKDIDAHLDEVLGIVETPQRDVAKTEKVKPLVNGQEDETDFQYARENLYNLIERGQDGLDRANQRIFWDQNSARTGEG